MHLKQPSVTSDDLAILHRFSQPLIADLEPPYITHFHKSFEIDF